MDERRKTKLTSATKVTSSYLEDRTEEREDVGRPDSPETPRVRTDTCPLVKMGLDRIGTKKEVRRGPV